MPSSKWRRHKWLALCGRAVRVVARSGLRIIGDYPALKVLSALKKSDGSSGAVEWRGGNGHQSVLWGVHPEKMLYRFIVEAPVAAVRFEEIPWPEHWGMNFNGNTPPAAAGEGEPNLNGAEATERMDDVELTPELKARIERYLAKVDPAVEGDYGSNPTFRVACILVWGFALSFGDAKPFMRAYSDRCLPPWSEKEIDHKLKDALDPERHKSKKPRGHLLGSAAGEYDDFFSGEKKLPELDSADQFCDEPDDTPPEIIEGILHQGSKGELGGGSKTFKTWTLLQMSVCVSHGIPWLGRNTHCGKVLFINFELPRWSIRHRVRHICDALEVDYPSNLKLLNLRGYATDAHVILPRIAKEIHKHGFTLVIIDPLYKILGDREENAAKDMADLMLAIERLAVF